MEKTFLRRGLYVLLVCVGILVSFAISAYTNSNRVNIGFSVNGNGQTYGSALHPEYEDIVPPDLILAVGVDGNEGYVLRSDLEGTGPLTKPQNPEEALVYMDQLEELVNDAITRDEKYLYYIPLYEADGTTVIGQFGVSIPATTDDIG
jgi:hypothetical protein